MLEIDWPKITAWYPRIALYDGTARVIEGAKFGQFRRYQGRLGLNSTLAEDAIDSYLCSAVDASAIEDFIVEHNAALTHPEHQMRP